MLTQLKKWLKEHLYIFALLYFIPYTLGYFLLGNFRTPVIWIHSSLDDLIPFNEIFIIPYVLWYLYVALTMFYFILKSKDDFLNMCFFTFAGTTVALIIYLIIPNAIDFRPDIIELEDNFLNKIVSIIYTTDNPTNVCPSIHVYASITTFCMHIKSSLFKNKTIFKIASFIMMVLICISTVALKQHSIIDGFCALILSIVLYYVTFHKNWRRVLSKTFLKKIVES